MPAPLKTSTFDATTLDEIHEIALSLIGPLNADYLEGGSGNESTLRRNVSDFSDWLFAPRVMSGEPLPDLSTSLFGVPLSMPVITAPFGSDRLFHHEGHLAVARANEAAGVVGIVPEASSFSYEEVRAASPAATPFAQLHPMGNEANFRSVVRRIEDAGYSGLVITCDCPTVGWRERNLRNRYEVNPSALNGNYPPGGEVMMEDAFGQLFPHYDAVWSWQQLAENLSETQLPWVAKGILGTEDAEAALDAGASGIYVSNHGGRQLHEVRSAIDALPEVAAFVDKRVPVLFDSGIRSGADVIKAVALGADVAVLGRTAVYGLAAGGQAGIEATYSILRQEMTTILALLGRGSIRDITPSALIRKAHS